MNTKFKCCNLESIPIKWQTYSYSGRGLKSPWGDGPQISLGEGGIVGKGSSRRHPTKFRLRSIVFCEIR